MKDEDWYDVWRLYHRGELEEAHVYVRFIKQDSLSSIFLLLEIPSFENLASIDISNCKALDPTSFTEVCHVFKNLQTFFFRGCVQFTQYHLAKIIDQCRTLTKIDGTGACEVAPTWAIAMLCSIPKVRLFWVVPCCKQLKGWALIVSQWRRVNFGLEINSRIPRASALEDFLESLNDFDLML